MKKLLLLLTVLLVLSSCSKENVNTETTADLTMQLNMDLNAKEQTPLASLDNEFNGIYLGVYVSATTTERGLIWINLGNNGKYNAIVEMTNGETLKFKGQSISRGLSESSSYHFVADGAEFSLRFENNVALIENARYNNELFFGAIVKDRSNTRAMAQTGTWINDNGNNSGTWNLIADGTIVNPNGFGGEGITAAVATIDGTMYTDTVFENFNFVCLGNTEFVPVIVDFSAGVDPNSPASWGQTSFFRNTICDWGLILNTDGGAEYLDGDCNLIPAGRYTWGGRVTGDIFIDVN